MVAAKTPRQRARALAKERHLAAKAPKIVYMKDGVPYGQDSVQWWLALVEVGRIQRERADEDIATYVAGARAVGCSWSEIATRLGVTRQAANARWGPTT